MNKEERFSDESGSLSIEFIGLLPFVFILIVVIVQLIGTGTSMFMAQKAVNESAKVYSITKDYDDAEDILREVLDSSNILNLKNGTFKIENEGNNYFRVKFIGNHEIVFLPEKWNRTFEIPHQSYSRVIE